MLTITTLRLTGSLNNKRLKELLTKMPIASAGIMKKNVNGLLSIKQSVVISLLAILVLFVHPVEAKRDKERVLPTLLTMYQGQTYVVSAPNTTRISVGDTKLVNSTLLKNSEVVITAVDKGQTNMLFWYADNRRESMKIVVVEEDGWRIAEEVRSVLGEMPRATVRTVGRQVIVDGTLDAAELERVNAIKERYDDLLILATERSSYEQPMIYFDVQITEFKTDDDETLGITWSQGTPFLVGAVGKTFTQSGDVASSGYITSPDFFGTGSFGAFDATDKSSNGVYLGVFSEIASRIDFAEKTGSAIILASPRLSARSGGKAELTVGGETPVVTTSLNGPTVEYKEYGIIMEIEPHIDQEGRIVSRISTEISQLDLANAVDDYPAFLKRKTNNDVIFRPGDTLVLSGLITREEQYTYDGIKWLQDIPILGALFRSKSFVSGETELVIFVTPKIMGDLASGVNKEELDRADELLKRFEESIGRGAVD